MDKKEYLENFNSLNEQTAALKKAYLEAHQPLPVGKLVTVMEGDQVHLKGLLKGYHLYDKGGIISYVIAPLTKNGTPHKSWERQYSIDDPYFKVVLGVTL